MPDEHGGISREEAEAMGLIDHAEEARVHAHAVERLTELEQREDQTARHDGLGVALWRCGRCAELPGETKWFESPDAVCPYDHEPGTRRNEPGKWFPTDEAEALAEMRERFLEAFWAGDAHPSTNERIDAGLRAHGLTT